jgi:hypothetical protein
MSIVEKLEAATIDDTLKRSENPLAGGWEKPSWVEEIGKAHSESTGWMATTTGYKHRGARYPTLLTTGGATFAYTIVQIAGFWSVTGAVRSAAEGTEGAIWCCGQASQSGYRLRILHPGVEGTEAYVIQLARMFGGVEKKLAETEVTMDSSGEVGARLAIVVGNGTVYGFFAQPAGKFVELFSAKDSTYTEGYGYIEAKKNYTTFANFAVGEFEETVGVKGRVRHFGSESTLRTAIGNCNLSESMTMLAIARVEVKPAASCLLGIGNPGEEISGYQFGFDSEGKLKLKGGGAETRHSETTPAFDSAWKLFAVTNDGNGGAATPLFYLYDFSKEEWIIEEGAGTAALDSTPAPGAGGVVSFAGNALGSERVTCDIALAGMWPSRSTKAALGLLVDDVFTPYLREWRNQKTEDALDAYPCGLWLFNQATVSEQVKDRTGGGANEVAQAGTEVLSDQIIPRDYGEGLVYVKKGGSVTLKSRKVLRNGVLV